MTTLEAAVNEILRSNLQKSVFIEITPDLMKLILRGQPDESITYKGVRLFVSGKKDKILKKESERAL